MSRIERRTVLAGLTALALTVSAVGPCHCLLTVAACHPGAAEAEAHGCCEKPAGVQAVADECCESGPELLVASTVVPEVTPPTLQSDPTGGLLPDTASVQVAVARVLPPLPPDRTTVLLI